MPSIRNGRGSGSDVVLVIVVCQPILRRRGAFGLCKALLRDAESRKFSCADCGCCSPGTALRKRSYAPWTYAHLRRQRPCTRPLLKAPAKAADISTPHGGMRTDIQTTIADQSLISGMPISVMPVCRCNSGEPPYKALRHSLCVYDLLEKRIYAIPLA